MLTKIFFALGGAGLIMMGIAKGLKPAIKKAVEWGISKDHPEVRVLVLKYRPWIEEQFDAADAAIKEVLDEQAAADQAPKA